MAIKILVELSRGEDTLSGNRRRERGDGPAVRRGGLEMEMNNECPVCQKPMERCQDPRYGIFFFCPVHGIPRPGQSVTSSGEEPE